MSVIQPTAIQKNLFLNNSISSNSLKVNARDSVQNENNIENAALETQKRQLTEKQVIGNSSNSGVQHPDYNQMKMAIDYLAKIVEDSLSDVPGFKMVLVPSLQKKVEQAKIGECACSLESIKKEIKKWRDYYKDFPNDGYEQLNGVMDLLSPTPNPAGVHQKLKEIKTKIRQKELDNAKLAIDTIKSSMAGWNRLFVPPSKKALEAVLKKYEQQLLNHPSEFKSKDMKRELESVRESFSKAYWERTSWWYAIYNFDRKAFFEKVYSACYKAGESLSA